MPNVTTCANCQKTFDKCRDDMVFVKAYCEALEGMKRLLTRERDDARSECAAKDKEIERLKDELLKKPPAPSPPIPVEPINSGPNGACPKCGGTWDGVDTQHKAFCPEFKPSDLTIPTKPTKPLMCPLTHDELDDFKNGKERQGRPADLADLRWLIEKALARFVESP
jgi:hypothetical protein